MAPPVARCSAQIVPPWASTSPRAIARPRPAPPFACRAESSRQKRSNIRRVASGVRPSPVSSTVTRTWSVRRGERDGDRPVRGCVAERVREQVEQDALDLLGRATRLGDAVVDRSLERDVAGARFGLEAADARLDERGERDLLELVDERAGVDAGELEEVVDENRQAPRLILQGREVLGRRGETVLDRLEHRCDRGHGRAQVVARRRDELAAGVEEAFEAAGHRVERPPQLGELARAALGCARAEVAGGERAEAERRRSIRARSTTTSTSAAATAADAEAAATARILTSSPMWNITQPESSTASSGSTTESNAKPASCRRTLGRRRRRERRREPDASVPAATARASAITAGTCSRRPRSSRAGADSRGRARSWRGAGGCAR